MTDIAINPVTRRVQFQGTTGTGPFAFNFNILQASDIAVYKNNTLLSIGTGATNYSVSIASNGTGSVSVVTALIASDVLVIIGGRELSRTTDFVTAGDLLASSLNEQLDSNVVMSQQLDESISRSIRAQPGDTEKTLTLPLIADRANELIKFDASGNVTTVPVSEVVGTDIDTQKITVKTSGGVVKAVIDGNTTNIVTVTGPVVLKEGTNTRITINPAADNNSFTSDANFSLISTSGDIDIKPGGGQINLLGTSGQQRIAFDNAAQATMQYFQNSNTTKLGVVDPTGARTLLLPNASDTLVGKATTDTLTNKTLASPVITGSLAVGTLTGSGDILLDATGDIVLDAAGDQIFFKDGGTLRITFELGAAGTSMVSASELVMAVTSGGINFKPQTGNVDFLQNSGAQAVQINSAGSSTITYYQNSNTTKLGVVNPTGSRVLLLPNASDTLVGLATTDTLTNKTLANPTFTGNLNFSGDIALDAAGDITLDADGGQIFIKDGGALKLTFTGSTLTSTGLDGINLHSSNDISLKAAGGQVDFLASDGSQRILINNDAAPTIKYFQNSNTTSLGITNPTGTRLLLLPDASDTLVGRATTDTLTNKTLTSPTITGGLNMSDVDITNVGSISLDRIANDGGTGITLDSSVSISIDSSNGQVIFKQNGATRVTLSHNSSGLQTLTAAGIFSITAASDINLRPNGGQVYILNNSGGDNFQFNTSSTPTLAIHQNSNRTNLGLVSPTATRNILFPDASDTLVGKATTDTLTNKTLTSPVINTGVSGSAFLDEDNFASNSATKIASQQSIKAYVDAATAGGGAGSLSTVLGIGNTTGSNNVLFGDGNKAIFGAGSDLQIYHDGNSKITDVGDGKLELHSNGTGVFIQKGATEYMAQFLTDGAVTLYHDNAAKIATTAFGSQITGSLAVDTITNASSNTDVTIDTNFDIILDAGGGVGIGVVPEAWSSLYGTKALQVGAQASLSDINGDLHLSSNTYYDTTNARWEYINADYATKYTQTDGVHQWLTAASGSADAAITWSESMRIDSSGRVGIGTSSPAANLHLKSTTSGDPELRIEGSGTDNGIITFLGGGHSNPAVAMRYISSGDSVGHLAFYANGSSSSTLSERMRIDSSGNVLVGKTITSSNTAGIRLTGSASPGYVELTRSGGNPLYLNRQASTGEIVRFDKDGSPVGSIGVLNSNNLTVSGTVADHGGLQFATHCVIPMEANADSNGTIDLGASGSQFKDAYLSGGVVFGPASGSTVSSQTLDTYEEGTWTPTFTGGTVSGQNATGYYTRVGNRVFFNYYTASFTLSNASGSATLGGLPYASSNASNNFSAHSVTHANAFASSGVGGGFVDRGQSHMTFMVDGAVTYSSWSNGTGRYFMVAGHYMTA